MRDQQSQGCKAMEESLSAYLDGELEPPGVREVEEHLRLCRQCTSALEGLRSAIRAVGSISSPRTPDGFKARLLEKIQSEEKALPPRSLPFGFRYAATGLAAAFLIVLTLHLGGVLGGLRSVPVEIATAPERAGGVADLDGPPSSLPARDRQDSARGSRAEGRKRLAPETAPGASGVGGMEAGGLEKDGLTMGERSAGAVAVLPEAAGKGEKAISMPHLTKEMDSVEEFKKNTPRSQTVQIAWSNGDEGRRALIQAIERYQSPGDREDEISTRILPAPAETGAGLGEAKRAGAPPRARAVGGDSRLEERAEPREGLSARMPLEQYIEFLDFIDGLADVELQESPEKSRWYLMKGKTPKTALAKDQGKSDDPVRDENGYFRGGGEAAEKEIEEGEDKAAEKVGRIETSTREKKLLAKKKARREIKRSLLRQLKEAVELEESRRSGVIDVRVDIVD